MPTVPELALSQSPPRANTQELAAVVVIHAVGDLDAAPADTVAPNVTASGPQRVVFLVTVRDTTPVGATMA